MKKSKNFKNTKFVSSKWGGKLDLIQWNRTKHNWFYLLFGFIFIFYFWFYTSVVWSHQLMTACIERSHHFQKRQMLYVYPFVEFYRDRQLLYSIHTTYPFFFAFSLSSHEIHSPYSIVLFVYSSSLHVLIASQVTLLELFVHVFHSHTQL